VRATPSVLIVPLEEEFPLVAGHDLLRRRHQSSSLRGRSAAVVATLMVRPVCPQLRKCRVRPGGYAWCYLQISFADAAYPTFLPWRRTVYLNAKRQLDCFVMTRPRGSGP
jgi:hypothetical protein